jgi:hypothetical protein
MEAFDFINEQQDNEGEQQQQWPSSSRRRSGSRGGGRIRRRRRLEGANVVTNIGVMSETVEIMQSVHHSLVSITAQTLNGSRVRRSPMAIQRDLDDIRMRMEAALPEEQEDLQLTREALQNELREVISSHVLQINMSHAASPSEAAAQQAPTFPPMHVSGRN